MTVEGKKNHLAVIVFLALFGALLTVATFFDLEVSRILTHFSLKEGEFYTSDVFANFFEAVGMLPRYLLRAFAALSMGWLFCKSFTNRWLSLLFLLAGVGVATYLLSGGFRDMILYPMRHMIAEDAESALAAIDSVKPTVYVISYVMSLGLVSLAAYLTRDIKLETWRRLAYFAVVYFILDLLAGTVVSRVKGYVDRVRFRSMNSAYGQSVGGFDLYTRWYEVTDHADLMRATPLVDYTDAFRSFPSGHTESAALTYSLILLIDCLKIENKKVKLALWLVPILWTGLTAIGRIVAGAHFMSDVLVGGTIPFVLTILLREIFFRKFRGVKAMFPFLEKKPA